MDLCINSGLLNLMLEILFACCFPDRRWLTKCQQKIMSFLVTTFGSYIYIFSTFYLWRLKSKKVEVEVLLTVLVLLIDGRIRIRKAQK
jgi:hypothetical protein